MEFTNLPKTFVVQHLKNDIIYSQYDFQCGKLCPTNLIEVAKNIDEEIMVDIVYVYFSNTFDKEPHWLR